MLFELAFENIEQRERIGCRARVADQHLVFKGFADLAPFALDNGVIERKLSVAADCRETIAAHREYCSSVIVAHERVVNEKFQRGRRSLGAGWRGRGGAESLFAGDEIHQRTREFGIVRFLPDTGFDLFDFLAHRLDL